MSTRSAFTLVEALVVVTIIAILMALLMPVLEQAVYRAELVVCAGNFKGICTTVTIYTSGNKRFYPDRTISGSTADTISAATSAKDDRQLQ